MKPKQDILSSQPALCVKILTKSFFGKYSLFVHKIGAGGSTIFVTMFETVRTRNREGHSHSILPC
jgi:hypothetical protein